MSREYDKILDHRKHGAGYQYQLKVKDREEYAWLAAGRIRRELPLLVAAFEIEQAQLQQQQLRPQAPPVDDREGQQHDAAAIAAAAAATDAAGGGTIPIVIGGYRSSTADAAEMDRMRKQLDEQTKIIQQMYNQPVSRFAKAQPRAQELDEYQGAAGLKLDEWLEKLGRVCTLYSLNDEETLQFAGSRLSGAALQWWNALGSTERRAIVGRTSLAAALRKRFQPITAERTARDQLRNLHQTGDVNVYIAEFQRLTAIIPRMDDASALHAFEAGLRTDIAEKLRIQGVSNLMDAIALAARVGALSSSSSSSRGGSVTSRLHQMNMSDDESAQRSLLERMEATLNAIQQQQQHSGGASSSSGLGAKTQAKQKYAKQRQRQSQRPPAPMPQIDIPGVPADVLQQRWTAKLCLRCGQEGHRSMACPNGISSSN